MGNFPEALKKARAAANITQQAMSEIMLIPRRTIEDWESGKHSAPSYVQRFVLNELAQMRQK